MKSLLRKAIYKTLTTLMDREKLMFLLSDSVDQVLLGFKRANYLYDIGWTNSIATWSIVDADNNPLPWATYPFIQFIAERLNNSLDVFEFGSGNSTLYYANRVRTLTSVEHDRFWYDKINSAMPPNVDLCYCSLDDTGDYVNYAVKTKKLYDIIIVDGMERVDCCINNIDALKPFGVVIIDDTERVEYAKATSFLKEKGFKRLDFWGTAPAVYYLRCTTIFYRPANCLEI